MVLIITLYYILYACNFLSLLKYIQCYILLYNYLIYVIKKMIYVIIYSYY